MNMKNTLFFLCFLLFKTSSLLVAQCLPFSGSNQCKDAKIFCSLDDLNGYQCSNPDNSPVDCTPFYPFIGPAYKAGWWAFVCDGGLITIDVEIISCQGTGDGIKIGLLGGCECDFKTDTRPTPKCIKKGTYQITESLTACKTYYLYIEGCDGDICDFIIHTSGGSAPKLSPLGKINNDKDGRIEVYKGCPENYKVTAQNNGCEPTYVWTVDGVKLSGNNDNIDYTFQQVKNFQLCVTAYNGNPYSGNICDSIGPECVTIESRALNYPIPHIPKCAEIVRNKPCDTFQITKFGCLLDSIICYDITLPVPYPPTIYHIACDAADVYIDPSTKQVFNSCQNDEEILLPKSTLPYHCDSSYKLTAIFLDFGVSFREDCIGDKIEIVPRVINRTKSCGGGESFEFIYQWYEKNDKSRKYIGTNEILQVDQKGEYCLEIAVKTKLGIIEKKCVFEFCENINENDFAVHPTAKLKGFQLLCSLDTSCIQLLEAPQNSTLFSWNVTGGTILTPNPFLTNQICVLWNNPSGVDGKVCASYETNCGRSDTTCLDVKFGLGIKDIAGINKSELGLKTILSAKGMGYWQKLSGPGRATFANMNDPNTSVTVSKYGIYVFQWSSQQNGCTINGIVTIKFIRN